jgi:hypothetical protein
VGEYFQSTTDDNIGLIFFVVVVKSKLLRGVPLRHLVVQMAMLLLDVVVQLKTNVSHVLLMVKMERRLFLLLELLVVVFDQVQKTVVSEKHVKKMKKIHNQIQMLRRNTLN